MSFLLDALRKSENQKRLGSTPNIHTASGFETGRPASRRLGLAGLVLLPAVLVLAWFGVKDMWPVKPQVAPGANQQAVVKSAAQPEPESIPTTPEAANSAGSNRRPVTERTPVENLQDSAPIPASGKSGSAARAQDVVTVARDRSGDLSSPSLPVSSITLAVPELSKPGEHTRDESDPADSPPGQEFPRSDPEFRAHAAIEYWQLPETLRSELGTMRITVMVYSEQPQERFILLNGKRVMEGDEPQKGLVLQEIRREGAVFSFRLYKFLITR